VRAVRIHALLAGLAIVTGVAGADGLPPAANFIDQEIRAKWAASGRQPASLSTDEQFLRRVTLDLTGRIPSPETIRAFVSDSSANKRSALIDRLLEAPEFTDRWSQWYADLTQQAHNAYRGYTGRNAFFNWTRNMLAQRRSLRDIVVDTLATSGNNYDVASGGTNYFLVTRPAGPQQDTYDLLFARAASAFLGIGAYDCLLCHNGRGHLESVSLWGSQATRQDAEKMAAFFSRFVSNRAPVGGYYFDSNTVSDASEGTYRLGTADGNRPPRIARTGITEVRPVYRDGTEPQSENWRAEFARLVTGDRMFARNIANRLWKEMMGRGLVEPVNGLDPARLDPSAPPPDPWTLQASHPELLEKLASKLVEMEFDLRQFVGLIAHSSAYQLDSRVDDSPPANDGLYLRFTPRRLQAEFIHDAVIASTGVPATYRLRTTAGYEPDPVHWATQLPGNISLDETDPVTLEFLQSFFPGDRNLLARNSAGSVMQQLDLLNSPFVTDRIKMTASPILQLIAAKQKDDDVVEELYLRFLSRFPTENEAALAAAYLGKAKSKAARNAAIEDLAWVCINRPEFIINH
jgi:hypothetical protein